MVEYARIRFTSYWATAMVAAYKAVTAPMAVTTLRASGDRTKMSPHRTTMYTPAVTIVAAWIRADTGLGPSIASGSQTYSGICALLPIAPQNSSRAIVVHWLWLRRWTFSKTTV